MNPVLPFEWVLATRFLREGLLQTLFIISGVALGVSVIVFMSALLTGLQSSIFKTLLDYQAQIVISPPDEAPRALRRGEGTEFATLVQPKAQRPRSIDQWQKVRDVTLAIPGVLVVAPVVDGAAFILRGDANTGVAMRGIEPESYLRLIALKEKIIAGKADVGSADIVIGSKLAMDLGVSTGDKLTLQAASGVSTVLFVSGIFDFGNQGQNTGSVYVALRTAQSLLGLPGSVTSLQLKTAAPFDAESLAQQIEAQPGIKVESWIKTNAEFFKALSGQTMSFFVIRLFVGLTAALGIASVLVVSVVQKSKEIGILRATGTTRGQILGVFLLQGAILGLLGSLFGSIMGWLFLIAWRGFAINDAGVPFFVLEAGPSLYLVVALGATLVGTLSALFPAQRAARLDPAVAIRG
ncbi:MAG: ABC transporter permease [Polaromonas sp.]|jgi:lipoprotein-releasing system permease protein